MDIKLKAEFNDHVIGFNNSAAPLGERKDLDKLVVMAHRAGRQDYLDMFDNPPSLDEVLGEVADTKIAAIVKPYEAPAAYPISPATPLTPEQMPPADTTPTREVEPLELPELPVLPEVTTTSEGQTTADNISVGGQVAAAEAQAEASANADTPSDTATASDTPAETVSAGKRK